MKTISWYEKAKEELKARNSQPENPEGEKVTPEAEPKKQINKKVTKTKK